MAKRTHPILTNVERKTHILTNGNMLARLIFTVVVGHWYDTIDASLSDILVVTDYSQRNF